MSNARDIEDDSIENPSLLSAGYYLRDLINAVLTYQREQHCEIDAAIVGICEGHELSAAQEADLREHFGLAAVAA